MKGPGLLWEGSAETLLGRRFTVSQRLLLGREFSDAPQLGEWPLGSLAPLGPTDPAAEVEAGDDFGKTPCPGMLRSVTEEGNTGRLARDSEKAQLSTDPDRCSQHSNSSFVVVVCLFKSLGHITQPVGS